MLLFLLFLLLQAPVAADADHDGIRDQVEQELLQKFVPVFYVSADDCDSVPTEFIAGSATPLGKLRNGAIYGQVMPRAIEPDAAFIEIHYYHLWQRDCGISGHNLDAEHVSVLLRADRLEQPAPDWRAIYWYAAAHEDTICQASRVARAETLSAQNQGAEIWISKDKHASFLSESNCTLGCGENHCPRMVPLHTERLINLGEPGYPMNGATWVQSDQWSLAQKMDTDFPVLMIVRLQDQGMNDIVLTNTPIPPTQAIILSSNSAFRGLLVGGLEGTQGAGKALKVTGKSLMTVGRKLRLLPAKKTNSAPY